MCCGGDCVGKRPAIPIERWWHPYEDELW